MKPLLLLILVMSMPAFAQKISVEDDIVRRWLAEDKAPAAAAFLDASILIGESRAPEERIRLYLLSAITHAQTGHFTNSYRRVRQAEDLLEWSRFRDRLTYNEKARDRIRSSIDLVLHDIRASEGKARDEVLP